MEDKLKQLVKGAINKNATDIHLVMLEKFLSINFRINGKLEEYICFEKNLGIKLINYIKFTSKIDVANLFKPQTGRIVMNINNHLYYLRVSILPSMQKDSLVIRILNQQTKLHLEKICQNDNIYNFLSNIAVQKHGLFLICGPTGSGKSTTLYALLDEIAKPMDKNIVTLEDPVEIVKDNLIQINIQDSLGIDYASCLKQILRHDPDVIMISEIREEITAKMAIRCALTGHLVLATIHSGSVKMVLERLLDLNITVNELKQTLIGVASQNLIVKKNHRLAVFDFANQEQIMRMLAENYE